MQSKINLISETAKIVGLKIHIHKIKTYLIYDKGDMESFCYLDSIIVKSGGSSADAARRINNAFAKNNSFGIFISNVKFILPFSSLFRLFVKKCLRRI